MKRYTYKEAYDKIIDAYLNDKLQPYDREFCFCGTLGCIEVVSECIRWDSSVYSSYEYYEMESALLISIRDLTIGNCCDMYVGTPSKRDSVISHPKYEDAVFEGMCAALEVLKKIHIERGEIIKEDLPFTKRQLTHE